MTREKRDEDLFQNSTMTFGEHLEELRTCLWRAILGVVIGFLIGIPASKYVVNWIQVPLKNALVEFRIKQADDKVKARLDELVASGYHEAIAAEASERRLAPKKFLISPVELASKMGVDPDAIPAIDQKTSAATDSKEASADEKELVPITLWEPIEGAENTLTKSLNPHEAFAVYIKAALLVGLVIASPWVFYQIWAFVAAGLYPHEKKYVHVFLPISLGLFAAGVATVFLFVFQPVLDFLFMFNSMLKIDPDPRIEYWLSFVLILPLGFGISFQLPLVMLFLERIGIFTVKAYVASWRVAVLVIFVIAMFLTPADPTSMILMAAPLCVLYFGGILMCRFMPRNRSPYDDLDETAS